MSEDEVKPQSEEPTPEAVKKDEDVKEEKIEDGDSEKDTEEAKENDKEDDEMESDTENLKLEEDDEELEKKEVKEPKPRKKATKPAAVEETKTPEIEKDPGVPLYDQPLEIVGKRDRKKVERFIQEEKKEELKFEGVGTSLGDIPFIEAMLLKTHPDELKVLHRVAYNRPGSGHEIKKNLRKFNGFAFSKDDKKFESKTSSTEKIMKVEITKMLHILGLERSGSKGEVVERFLDFMASPQDMGKKPPKVKKVKARGRPKKGQDKAKNASTESVSDAESGDDSSDDDNNDEDEEPEEKEEEEEKVEKVKKPKKTPAKKTPAKKTPAKAKKTPAKRPASAKKPAKASKPLPSDDSDDGESDDEPLAKKKKQFPTDGEIKAMVKKILDGANLEEVTMKSVCRQVYESYPEFDLIPKKDFIKETVKSIIS